MQRVIIAILILAVTWPADADARRRRRRRRRKKPRPVKVEELTGKKKARYLFATGQKFFRQKNYAEAIKNFEGAYELWKHKVIEFNIALCYAFLGEKIKSAAMLRKYLAGVKGTGRKLPVVLQNVRNQTGVLVVNTPDPNAEIFVDGKLVGKGRAEVILEIGQRAIDIRLGDRIAARKTIEVVPKEERLWELKEIPKPPPAPRVPVPRDTDTGTTTTTTTTPTTTPTITVRRKAKGVHWGAFTGMAAVALAGAAAGVTMDMMTRKAHDDFVKTGETDADLKKKGLMYRNITIAMWGVTGAAGITAAVLAIFTRWRKYEKVTARVSVMPMAAPGTLGLSMEYRR